MKVKSLLLALGLSLVVGESFAISFKVDGINYVANADTAIVKGYSEIPENGELKLASTVTYGGKDYRVTTVQSSAFLSCTEIKKLTVPASIKYIQRGAFESCVNMSNLVLEQGEDVLDAASDAFKKCNLIEASVGRNLKISIFNNSSSLLKVTLGENIKRIIPWEFSSCSNLKEINLDGIEEIGYGSFSSCYNLESVSLSSVKFLGEHAFGGCCNLINVEISNIITEIPTAAFDGCGFSSFSMKQVVSIGDEAFKNCDKLENVDWANVSSIGNFAFENCGFKSLKFPSTLSSIGFSAFSNCLNLESVDLGETVITVVSGFKKCSALKEVKLPISLISIGASAFGKCISLSKINLPTTLKEIRGGAFEDCSSLEVVKFPSSLEYLGNSAFYKASKLREIDLSHTKLHNVSEYCFGLCTSLVKISLAAQTDTIFANAFKGCGSLVEIANSNDIKMVHSGAFDDTKFFDNVTDGPAMIGRVLFAYKGTIKDNEYIVPDGVTCIADSAFVDQKFQSIKLNKGLKYIGFGTFNDCSNLVALNIPSSVDIIQESSGCDNLVSIRIQDGESVLKLGQFKKSNVKKLYLGRNVEQIDWMPNLTSLTIGGNVNTLNRSFKSISKLSILEIEDAANNLDLGEMPVKNVKSLYLGRNIKLDTNWWDHHFLSLEQLSIGEMVDSIPDSFVEGNEVIKEVDLPSTVRVIGVKAFSDIVNVEKFTLHDGLEKISDQGLALRNIVPLDTMYIPRTVKGIWIMGCAGIKCKKLILPEGLKGIGYMAFYNLETDSVTLPSTLEMSSEVFAFSGIKYFDASKYSGNLNSSLEYNRKLEKVILPKEEMNILSENEFWECNSLKNIELPNTIDSISSSVLCGTQIKEVHIPKSVRVIVNRMFCEPIQYKPTIYIDGNIEDKPIRLNTTFEVDMHKVDVGRNFSYCFYADVSGEYEAEMPWNTSKVNMDSLVIRDVKAFDVLTKAESIFVPSTAICLSHYLTSCDMWKPTNGKVFVLPGSQLPKDDVTYMYTVNKLEYVPDADGNVLFDGVNNMPYDITPVFYQDDKEVELKEAGVYDLSMKIDGTSFDGVYPTGLKVSVASTSGINHVILDTASQHCPIYNMNGQRVDDGYKGIVIQNGKKRIAK